MLTGPSVAMDIFFQDPNEVPLPPDKVRIREIHAEPRSDRHRVRVMIQVDPFQSRPSAELLIYNEQGEVVAQANIIEAFTPRIELTMHIQDSNPSGRYMLKTLLYYEEIPEAQDINQEVSSPKLNVIDEGLFEFIIPEPENHIG